MTQKEFYIAVLKNEISDEVIKFAGAALAKMQADAEKRKNTKTKARLENEALAAKLAEALDFEKAYTAAQIGAILDVNTSKATAVAKVLVEFGQATVTDVKGEKGKCKGYTLVSKTPVVAEAEAEAEVVTENPLDALDLLYADKPDAAEDVFGANE